MQIVLVSGLSGSGKSIAIAVLEDAGYYCVDNQPLPLLEGLIDYLGAQGHSRVAIAIDARSGDNFKHLPAVVAALRTRDADLRIIFLEAKTLSLVKRFSETRRRHPLSNDQVSLSEAIQLERDARRHSRARPSHRHQRPRARRAAAVDQGPDPAGPLAHHPAVRVVRFQARHPARRRPGVRRALPAQPHYVAELRR
jgi:Predicted P-loop-containing kinase